MIRYSSLLRYILAAKVDEVTVLASLLYNCHRMTFYEQAIDVSVRSSVKKNKDFLKGL